MRRGELLGPTWPDVHLDRGMLAERRTLSRGKGGAWEPGTPKSTSGRCSIALPPSAVEGLKRHRVRQLERRLALGAYDGGFVFTNGLNAPLHANSVVLRFARLAAAAGVPRIRLHDPRRTGAISRSLISQTPPCSPRTSAANTVVACRLASRMPAHSPLRDHGTIPSTIGRVAGRLDRSRHVH